jgi:DNA-binding transcriptional LysR family regulator
VHAKTVGRPERGSERGRAAYPLKVEWRALVYLVAIVDHGSFGRAAEALHLTQPALSKSIRRLEKALRVRVLERTPRGVLLTRDGEYILESAREVVATLIRAEREAEARQGSVLARVHVGLGRYVNPQVLAAAMRTVIAASSATELVVADGSAERLIRGVQAGDLDLALVCVEASEVPARLEARELARDAGVLAARAGHVLARQRTIGVEALAAAEWVLPPKSHPLIRQLAPLAAARGAPLRVRAQTSSLQIARELVASSDAVTVLPRSFVGRSDHELLVELASVGFEWSLPVTLIARGADVLPPCARRLYSALAELPGAARG